MSYDVQINNMDTSVGGYAACTMVYAGFTNSAINFYLSFWRIGFDLEAILSD